MPSSLVTAFRQQFPRGSILSEVLTIHDGLFVVRVSVSVEGNPLSQGLGANNSLELAEDIACNRALERLALTTQSIEPSSGAAGDLSKPESTTQPIESSPGATGSNLQSTPESPGDPYAAPEPPPAPAQITSQVLPVSPHGASAESGFQGANSDQPQIAPVTSTATTDPEEKFPDNGSETTETDSTVTGDVEKSEVAPPVLKLATPPNTKPKEAAESASEQDSAETASAAWPKDPQPDFSKLSTAPVDLSDIIAQTDVELQRLGWDVHQGREFLERTYGKRSRHDLTDEELLEFLLYLESQPAPTA